MPRRRRSGLPPPTAEERWEAGAAARALRAALADPASMGPGLTMHVSAPRPVGHHWFTTWDALPGFSRSNGRYAHACLPGWTYSRAELETEMIPDLEALARAGLRPTQETAADDRAGGQEIQEVLPLFGG